jgi:NAD(P)-dependent dehydrogenase (short-subunit alcohol dehydrogenase family)
MEKAPVVLITGASRGIGAATARRLLAQGCRLAAAARIREGVASALAEVAAPDEALLVLAGDVARPEDSRRWVAETLARFGRLDGLVNNAGVLAPLARLADAEPADWHDNLAVNRRGPFHLAQAAIPPLRETRGRIVKA